MEELARTCDDEAHQRQYDDMAARAQNSFNRLFWNDVAGFPYDVVNGAKRDGAVRPNQIFALSLPYSMLSPDLAKCIVDMVERALLTPYGLRSLLLHDLQYRRRCKGDPASRDSAYHQGMIRPWLMGPFITAYVKVHKDSAAAREQASAWLSTFWVHLHDAGLGQISRILDGEVPRQPRGCMAQA